MKRLLLLLSALACATFVTGAAAQTSAVTAVTGDRLITVTNQNYPAAYPKGKAFLTAIGTQVLKGFVTSATLTLTVSRCGTPPSCNKGWSAVGMYVAPLAIAPEGYSYPNESVYGTRLKFVNAIWNGDGKRHLSPSSSFGVLKQHENSMSVDLSAVPVAKGDTGSDTTSETIDIAGLINAGGVYLGFAPSSPSYHVTAVIRYQGTLTAKPF